MKLDAYRFASIMKYQIPYQCNSKLIITQDFNL